MLCYQAGDASAFNELYGRHKNQLYGFLLRASPNNSIAEDLVQETWTSLIKRAASYRPDARFKTYLYTIARHKLIDYLRYQAHRKTESIDDEQGEIIAEDSQALSPLNQVVVSRLLEQIKLLPGEQREAFLLKEEGFSLQEIAAITGKEPETVKSRIRYARARLRETMEQSRIRHSDRKQECQS